MKQIWAYLAQADAAKRPLRVKIGVTTNTSDRLRQYRTLCPETKFLMVIPLFKSEIINVAAMFERDVVKMFELWNFKRVGESARSEVFDVQSVHLAAELFEKACKEANSSCEKDHTEIKHG